MTDDFTGHRRTRFVLELLDREERVKRTLRRVGGGEVTFSATTRLKSSGTVEIQNPPEGIDWLNDRVRVSITINDTTWSLGVFLIAAPETQYSEDGKHYRVELISKLAILDQQAVEQTFSLPTGTPVLETIQRLIHQTGETKTALTPSNAVVRNPTTWEAGTPYLTIINDLLKAIGYWSLNIDEQGAFIASPYTKPNQRPTIWEFREGENATHLARWNRNHDTSNIPNKIVLVTNTTPPLTAIATNTNPASPYSFGARGRWIVRAERGVDAVDEKVLKELAQRKLLEASSPQGSLEVEFMPLKLSPHDIVRWRSQGHECLASVQSLRYSLSPTALCKTTLKEVVEL